MVGQQSSLQEKIISKIKLVVDRYLQTVSRFFLLSFHQRQKTLYSFFDCFYLFIFMVIATTYQLTFVHCDVERHWASQALQLFTKASLDSSVF